MDSWESFCFARKCHPKPRFVPDKQRLAQHQLWHILLIRLPLVAVESLPKSLYFNLKGPGKALKRPRISQTMAFAIFAFASI